MKVLKPILYCLLWFVLAFLCMYLINNKRVNNENVVDKDVPIVELRVSKTNINVWDTVTYFVLSRVESDNENFEKERLFHYDFNWDWIWDLVSKNDTETYTFLEPYEDWAQPRVAVEFSWKADVAYWDTIFVKGEWVEWNFYEEPVVIESEYEKNRDEILALLPTKWDIRQAIEWMFNDFEEKIYAYTNEEKSEKLKAIWNTIIKDWNKNNWMLDESDFTLYFCSIFNYYGITDFTDKC